MFLKNLGQTSLGGPKSTGNLIALLTPGIGCCGDNEDKAVACRYMTVIDTASVTTLASVRIAGVTYTFDATWATTTEAGRAGIITEIKKVMTSLGYIEGHLLWTNLTGAFWTLHFDFSTLVPEWIGASGNQFVPVSCFVIGHRTSTDTGFSVFVTKKADLSYDVTLKFYAGEPITTLTVTYNAVSKAANPAAAPGNILTFNTTAVLAEAETALVVTINGVAKTITEILANYKA